MRLSPSTLNRLHELKVSLGCNLTPGRFLDLAADLRALADAVERQAEVEMLEADIAPLRPIRRALDERCCTDG